MRLRITQAWMILGLFVVAACTDVSGPASPTDRLLNRDVAMVAADAALEDLSDLVELMMAGALAASTETTDRSSTRTRTVRITRCVPIHLGVTFSRVSASRRAAIALRVFQNLSAALQVLQRLINTLCCGHTVL